LATFRRKVEYYQGFALESKCLSKEENS